MDPQWRAVNIQKILNEITTSNDPAVRLLSECGPEYESLLMAAASLSDESTTQHACETIQALIDTSYKNMVAGSSVQKWRRMHTDASILQSLAPNKEVNEAIGVLDRAIITSGAAGSGRLDLIHFLIKRLQQDCRRVAYTGNASLSSPFSFSPSPLITASHLIPVLDLPPSLSSFRVRDCHHPFILRDYAREWPALSVRPWSSLIYLRSISGPCRLVPVEVGADYRTDDWTQQLMDWYDFLDSLTASSMQDVLYLAQHNLFMQFPALLDDIMIPDYLYTCPPAPLHCPTYTPPANDDQMLINAWLGPKGTISPAHTDPYFNFYVQVVGRKTVWLAPPEVGEHMQAYTRDDSQVAMTNTSRVDVFGSDGQHRQFESHVVPKAFSGTLESGDALFFPPGWWHGMRSEEPSFSVSMWF